MMSDESDLFPPPLTLRRQNAQSGDDGQNRLFVDSQTLEVVEGNPDLEHVSNQHLVRLDVQQKPNEKKSISILWQPGVCNSNLKFFKKNDDDDDHGNNTGLNLVSGLTS